MFEKISEKETRTDLIKQVKEKVLREIDNAYDRENKFLKNLICSDCDLTKEEIKKCQHEYMTDLLLFTFIFF